MTISNIILAFTTLTSLTSIFLIWKLFKRMDYSEGRFQKKISDIDIDEKVSKMFSGSGTKGVDDLAGTLFNKIKRHFNFKASSYSELVDEINSCPQLKNELGELLKDFFNKMIQVSYQKEKISEEEKDKLRKEIKAIVRRIQGN